MSIKEIKDSSGNVTYSVMLGLRSPERRDIRIQKSKFGIKTLAEAKKVEVQLRREIERELVSKEMKSGSWETLISSWEIALKETKGFGKIGETTCEDYVQALRIYTSKWNAKSPEEIHQMDVMAILSEMDQLDKSKSRKQFVAIAINQIFRWGIGCRLIKGITQSPAFGISVKREQERKPDILNNGQIRKLLEFAKVYGHEWYPIWACALLSGMRSGELHALKWKDVDLEGRILTVHESYNSRKKVEKSTKSGVWREVPINNDLLLLLKQLKVSSGGSEYVLPRLKSWTRGSAAKILRTFCQGVGIPPVCFHALRACFATQLLKNKVAPAIVMKIAGWKDLKTMQRYIRMAGIEIEGATDSLQLLSSVEVMGKVVELFGADSSALGAHSAG